MPRYLHCFGHPVDRAMGMAVWVLVGLVVQLGLGRSVQAGCEHARISVAQQDGATWGLTGKWQYAAGQVYFLFYPQSPPCDGPGCRQSPDSQNQMSTIPSSNDSQTSATARGTDHAGPITSSMPLGHSTDPMALYAYLAQLLRPPIA